MLFLSFALTLAATLLSALLAILCTLRRTLGLNLLAMFATGLLSTTLPPLLAVLSPLRLTLGLNLLATLAPTANILRPGLDVFFMPISLMFAAFGIVLVLQICIRILWSDCSGRNGRPFAVFTVPFAFLALVKGLRRRWSYRCTGFILESLAFFLTFALFKGLSRSWRHRRAGLILEPLAFVLTFALFEGLDR